MAKAQSAKTLNHNAVPGWRCADIMAPLRSKEWTANTSSILPHIRVRVS